MKTLYFNLIIAVFISFSVQAQVTNTGQPKSWKLDLVSKKSISLPSFDLKTLQEQDKINDQLQEKPFRFGYEHQVSLDLKDGTWNILKDGSKVWLLNVKSKGAKTLNFMFDEFLLPEGAKLYFYNDKKTDLLGAYTSSQNRADMQFGSWLIDGDNIWVEYYEPKNVDFNGQLHISKVVHGYRSVNEVSALQKDLNDSADCNLDVDCPIGSDFDDIKGELKKSVALVLTGSTVCSGTLINNTENDGQQYFLTANHCLEGSVGSWAFRFDWISPNPSCSTTVNSSNSSFNQTASGATLLANNAKSDFLLLEINATFPGDWDLVWAGWDRSGDIPDFTVGIHHPRGDIMKVSRDKDGPSKNSRPFNNIDDMDNWFLDEWELGVTEPGSSGSALFDPNGRIIGQLAGGAAACNGTVNNGAFDFYGRFDVSWDYGNSIDSRLKEWLDPNNRGVQVLGQYPPTETFAYDAALLLDDLDEPICGDEAFPVFRILNNGIENITRATLTYRVGSEPEQNISWSGNLSSGETDIITSTTLDLNLSNQLQAELVINGQEDEFINNNSINRSIDNYENFRFTTDSVVFTLLTDDYASETSWSLLNESGIVIEESQGNLTNNTTYVEQFEVEPGKCYELVIFDTEGDGICCLYGEGSYSLQTNSSQVIAKGGEFGVREVIKFRINEVLSAEDFEFSVFPNPSESMIRIEGNFGDDAMVSIFDLSGKLIYQNNNTENLEIDINSFPIGVYFLQIDNENKTLTKKFIKL
jgi:hypothetical protein